VSVRHIVLVAASVAVLGIAVYLFIEVHATPAQAQVTARASEPVREVAPIATPSPSPAVAPARPAPVREAPPQVPPALAAGDETQAEDSQPPFDPAAPLKPNTKLDAVMDQANKAYDRQDFEEARVIAAKVLQKQPTNVRMLRIMVSSSCIEGDNGVAQKYFEQLPKGDREQMKARCDRYGVTFKDPAQ
jgi:hypothetical protein